MLRLSLVTIFSLCAVCACTPKSQLQTLEWKAGDDPQILQSINQIEQQNKSSIEADNEKISWQNQSFENAIVLDSYIKRISSLNGDLRSVSAGFYNESIVQKNRISKDELLRLLQIPAHAQVIKTQTIYYVDRKKLEPGWQVVYFDREGQPWEFITNHRGKVLSKSKVGSNFVDVPAYIYPQGPKVSSISEVVLKGLQIEPALSSASIIVRSEADLLKQVPDQLRYEPSDLRFDQVQVFYYLQRSLQYFQQQLKVRMDHALDVVVHMGYPQKTNSAFYYEGRIRFGQGDGEVYENIPHDPSIVMHEAAHALIDQMSMLPFQGEGGSINEGLADFITGLQTQNPLMGEVAYLKGPYRRTMENTLKLQDKNGGLYHDSAIVSGTLWQLKGALGQAKIQKVLVELLKKLNPQSDLEHFGISLHQALAAKLNPEELEHARAILTQRGF